MIHQLIYASKASASFKEHDLTDILARSRKNNQRDGLTGILVYANRSFLQVLEGELSVVKRRYEFISQDPRHEWVLKLRQAFVPERNFPDWSMGLHRTEPGDGVFEALYLFQSTEDVLANSTECSDALLSSLGSFAKLHFNAAA